MIKEEVEPVNVKKTDSEPELYLGNCPNCGVSVVSEMNRCYKCNQLLTWKGYVK